MVCYNYFIDIYFVEKLNGTIPRTLEVIIITQ